MAHRFTLKVFKIIEAFFLFEKIFQTVHLSEEVRKTKLFYFFVIYTNFIENASKLSVSRAQKNLFV